MNAENLIQQHQIQLNQSQSMEKILNGGLALQQIRTQHQTTVAIQRPRDSMKIEREVEREAMLIGEDLFYQWTVSGADGKSTAVEGISINGALMLLKNWGNCAAEITRIEPNGNELIFYASFIDFETNFTYSRAHKIDQRFIIYGKYDEFRKDIMRFEIAQSKALRNVILGGMPAWLKDKAMKTAKQGARTKIEKYIAQNGIARAIELIVNQLKKYGIDEKSICQKFNIAETKALTIENLVMLKGDIQAIESGSELPKDLYPVENQKTNGIKERLDKKGKKAKKEEARTTVIEKTASSESIINPVAQFESKSETSAAPAPFTVFYQEWEAVSAADRLNKYIDLNMPIADFKKYITDYVIVCKDKEGKQSYNFSDLKVKDQVQLLWYLTSGEMPKIEVKHE